MRCGIEAKPPKEKNARASGLFIDAQKSNGEHLRIVFKSDHPLIYVVPFIEFFSHVIDPN